MTLLDKETLLPYLAHVTSNENGNSILFVKVGWSFIARLNI